MSKQTHYIKIDTDQFSKLLNGEKEFTVDIPSIEYKKGDTVVLMETTNGTLTGKQMPPFKLESYGLTLSGKSFYGVISAIS